MSEEAHVLPTRAGPVATILTLPTEEAQAIMLIVPAAGGTRAGVHQTWVRVSRDASELRVATLRADYAGSGESWDADPRQRSAAICDVARWTCERVGDVPLLLVANCFGLAPALSISRQRPVAGAAAMLPPVVVVRSHKLQPALQATTRDNVHATAARVRALPRRLAYRARYGPARPLWDTEEDEGGHGAADLGEMVSRTPTWLLMGSDDTCTEPVRALLPDLQQRGDVEISVVDGVVLRTASTPEAHQAIRDNVVSWVARSMTRLATPT